MSKTIDMVWTSGGYQFPKIGFFEELGFFLPSVPASRVKNERNPHAVARIRLVRLLVRDAGAGRQAPPTLESFG